jgi:hypothetical protein
MDKVLLLKEKASVFHALLKAHQDTNADAMMLLLRLMPLFQEIATGKVMPPKYYEHGLALGKDNPFYEPNGLFSQPEAEFIAALEDWASQPWYQEVLKRAGH